MKKGIILDWILRLFKGVFIGTGFILPGVSGGALAAIFGLYERLIKFIAHLTRDIKENILYFTPVGIGALLGVVILSYPLSYFLENYEAPTLWCFIGCIIGTFPSLWRQSGREGRRPVHIAVMALSAGAGYAALRLSAGLIDGQMPLNIASWLLAGVIIALGVLIPGLSPSNFLLYMGLYAPMVDAFKALDFAVLIPLAIGGASCMILFSKLVDWLFAKAFSGLFHVILGVVIASTVMIVPLDYDYSRSWFIVLAATCAGALLGWWMSGLEEKYKPQ